MQKEPSFGARLRQERERRQISIETIAASTKILGALLEGLEKDDVSRWPAGIYRRAFMRAYAGAIGLDPEPTLREFLERFPEPEDHPSCPLEAAVAPAPKQSLLPLCARERGGAVLFDAFVLTVIALTFYMAVGSFWAPFAVGAICYYFGGILLLGNTPGVYMFAAIASKDAAIAAAVPPPSTPPAVTTGKAPLVRSAAASLSSAPHSPSIGAGERVAKGRAGRAAVTLAAPQIAPPAMARAETRRLA